MCVCRYVYVRIHREIILSGNSHHSSLRPFRVDTGTAALAAISICRYWGVHMFYVCVLQLLLSFYTPLIEEVLKMVLLFSQTRVVFDRHFVHCTSEFYKLGGPTGSV